MKMLYLMLYAILSVAHLNASMSHLDGNPQSWKKENLAPFDELILTWNSSRPMEGKYLIYISVKLEDWSPWLLYASWGSEGQSSYLSEAHDIPVRTFQDTVEVLHGHKATGFQIQIIPEGGACINAIRSMHVYTNSDRLEKNQSEVCYKSSICLNVGGLSQMNVCHPRFKDLCSPTSTTAVVRYLSGLEVDPVEFAMQVWDKGFDIFGNWVFSLSQASTYLGSAYDCWVVRLRDFDEIYWRLMQGTPVIVSIRGPIAQSALPYLSGHLIAVTGFDAEHRKILCMDPAFPSDENTNTAYDLDDFLIAWNRRGRIAYIFSNLPELSN